MKITELDDERIVYKRHQSDVVHLNANCSQLHTGKAMERTAGKLFSNLTVCKNCSGTTNTENVDSRNNGFIEMLLEADPDEI